ncbi:Hsp20/alpha crystallin family protein [Bremerella sp. T1]|uniref:Hsp20/alpha crystallin family protein n=1 Tax=Bremerella sp. TYQ1 TaxID=3119568 RepID=UPI001CCCB6C9|nr:Hsp20/alpha crystallin family protein [Bremerella volcania]UBM33703.1 Hsp20/alpha crystallin family protein [Bremerella volcania]
MVRPQTQSESKSHALANWSSEMDNLFESFFRPVRQSASGAWMPAMNISESEGSYQVDLELPGLGAEDVNVELHDGKLTISGERKTEEQSEDRRWHRVEHVYGKFERVLKLGMPVDDENVSASFKNGVLSVTIPKSEQAKPKKIEVTNS